MADVYYKDYETNLFEVTTCKGWFISSDTIYEALGLANKRGDYKLEDLKQIGTCVTILGTSPNYEDVINMRDQLERAWGLLNHDDSALPISDVIELVCDEIYHKHCKLSSMQYKFCPECGIKL